MDQNLIRFNTVSTTKIDLADVHVRTCASLFPGTVLLVAPGAVERTQYIDADGRVVYEHEEIDWSKVSAVVNAGNP